MNISHVCEEYISAKSRKCRQNTLDGYISAIRCHVLPKWGGRDLTDIRRREVQEWVDSIPTAGAATKALKMLQQVYRWAIREYELEVFDPTSGVELPQRPIYRREVMSAKETARMLREAVGQPWEAVVILAASLGLRPSEACGVDWSDIDWRTGWTHIQRGAHTVKGGAVVEYACKTELSDRWLKLPRWALAQLRRLRGNHRSGRLRGELSPKCIYSRLKRILVRIGLPEISVQALRHTWATIAIEAGAALADVAVALGHTSVEMCRRHYLLLSLIHI